MTSRDTDHQSADATWSQPVLQIAFALFVMTVLVIAGIFLAVRTISGQPGPPVWFGALWILALGWSMYWWLFRVAYRVELVGRTLNWRAPLRSGSIPVDAIERAGRFFGAPSTCVLRGSGYPPVVVSAQRQDFTPMLQALNRLNPAVPADL